MSIISVIICLPSVNLFAKQRISSTYIFCAYKNNNMHWRWAVNEKNEYVTIKGYWKKVLEKDIASSQRSDVANYSHIFDFNLITFVFVTTYAEYYRVQRYCHKDEVMQPADKASSNWYGFEFVKNF